MSINTSNNKRPVNKDGRLLVVSGRPAAGKDAAFKRVLAHEYVRILGYEQLVTYADRPKRSDEIQGVDYNFVREGVLQKMYEQKLLVEKPVKTGIRYHKATPRSEFEKIIYEGKRKIWRIDPSRAAEVARGIFFDTQFTPMESIYLKKFTAVVFITADQETLERRRRLRHGKDYKKIIHDYIERDLQEQKVLNKFAHHFTNIIDNPDGALDQTVNKILSIIQTLHRNVNL